MNKKKIIQMLKDNPIKTIKCGDIEIPVEYLKQTTVNVNGNDYIRLQQENKQLKDNWDKLRELILEEGFEINTREYGSLDVIDKNVILDKMKELGQGRD